MNKGVYVPPPASGKAILDFHCKLCGKKIREQTRSNGGQFQSRFQHLQAKHQLSIHEFYKNFYTYVEATLKEKELLDS